MPKSETEHKANSAIVISSRVRLARNLSGHKFVSSANKKQLAEVYAKCAQVLESSKKLAPAKLFNMERELESTRALMVEDRTISKELDSANSNLGAFISVDGSFSVFINEEDHIRIQTIGSGMCLSSLYKKANAIDDELEKKLEFAFSSDIGYITSCPTNIGTGMRASVMLHLPALSIENLIDKVVRGVNQMGMAIRGANGEGSDSFNAFYQLSNQHTLGMTEEEIVKKIQTFCKKICQFEQNARLKLLQENPIVLLDKFMRARATLENCKLIDSDEALTNISALRLAADMNLMKDSAKVIKKLDDISLCILPSHMMIHFGLKESQMQLRDEKRAKYLNEEISRLPKIEMK